MADLALIAEKEMREKMREMEEGRKTRRRAMDLISGLLSAVDVPVDSGDNTDTKLKEVMENFSKTFKTPSKTTKDDGIDSIDDADIDSIDDAIDSSTSIDDAVDSVTPTPNPTPLPLNPDIDVAMRSKNIESRGKIQNEFDSHKGTDVMPEDENSEAVADESSSTDEISSTDDESPSPLRDVLMRQIEMKRNEIERHRVMITKARERKVNMREKIQELDLVSDSASPEYGIGVSPESGIGGSPESEGESTRRMGESTMKMDSNKSTIEAAKLAGKKVGVSEGRKGEEL